MVSLMYMGKCTFHTFFLSMAKNHFAKICSENIHDALSSLVNFFYSVKFYYMQVKVHIYFAYSKYIFRTIYSYAQFLSTIAFVI